MSCRATTAASRSATLDQNNWYIGAQAPIGLWTLKGSYGQVSRQAAAASASSIDGQDANQFALGATYDLSKRTALYGTWSGINNKDGASVHRRRLANVPAAVPVANENSQGFEFGIKHSF